MTDEMIALSRSAVACKGWQWMPGMLAALDGIGGDYRARVCRVDNGLFWSDATPLPYTLASYVPDLTDPATIGCLLALVREAYRDASKLWDGHVEVRRDHRILFFVVSFRHDASGALVEDTLATGVTEAEALVAALESAP